MEHEELKTRILRDIASRAYRMNTEVASQAIAEQFVIEGYVSKEIITNQYCKYSITPVGQEVLRHGGFAEIKKREEAQKYERITNQLRQGHQDERDRQSFIFQKKKHWFSAAEFGMGILTFLKGCM